VFGIALALGLGGLGTWANERLERPRDEKVHREESRRPAGYFNQKVILPREGVADRHQMLVKLLEGARSFQLEICEIGSPLPCRGGEEIYSVSKMLRSLETDLGYFENLRKAGSLSSENEHRLSLVRTLHHVFASSEHQFVLKDDSTKVEDLFRIWRGYQTTLMASPKKGVDADCCTPSQVERAPATAVGNSDVAGIANVLVRMENNGVAQAGNPVIPDATVSLFTATLAMSVGEARTALGGLKDVNLPTRTGNTLLILAISGAREENLSMVRMLVEDLRADVNRGAGNGATPLMAAASHLQSETARFLVRHQADLNAADPEGKTSLHYLVRGLATNSPAKGVELLRFFMDKGVNPCVRDRQGQTPLELWRQSTPSSLRGEDPFTQRLTKWTEERCSLR